MPKRMRACIVNVLAYEVLAHMNTSLGLAVFHERTNTGEGKQGLSRW
jgi:hypothetical protein